MTGGTDPGAGAAPVAGAGGGSAAGAGGAAPAGACPTGVKGHCDAGATYPTYDGFTLALVEDFTNPIDLNNDPIWTWSDGIPNDSQTGFAEANITFAGGKMILKAESKCAPTEAAASCYPPRTSYAESYSDGAIPRSRPAYNVISGELRTKYNNYRYGRYEVKLKAPNQPMGNYLSTMFVFRNPTNVAWNEIDIELEPWRQGQVNGNVVNAPTGAKQYPTGNAAPWNLPANIDINTEHVYAFTWTPTAINWYVDNSTTPIKTHAAGGAVAIPNLSSKIMMNLWVFASSAAFGDPKKNVFPMTAEYDWFHFYKWNTEDKYPVDGKPTGADYTPAAQNNPKEVGYGT